MYLCELQSRKEWKKIPLDIKRQANKSSLNIKTENLFISTFHITKFVCHNDIFLNYNHLEFKICFFNIKNYLQNHTNTR